MARPGTSIAGLVPLLLFAIVAAMAPGLASGGDLPPATAVTLYVANEGSSSIAIYPAGSSGLASPAIITGALTQLSAPIGLFVDLFGDLFVANFFGASVTEYGPTATESGPPSAAISGANTNLALPFGVALDPSGNIWVTNRNTNSNSVTEYVAGANHDLAPINTISGALTRLAEPSGIAIDPSGNIYVANTQSSTVAEFLANGVGNSPPAALISGPMTGLNDPVGIALDSSGNIYVSNIASSTGGVDSIVEYAADSNGNMAPIATISGGQTGLGQPYGVAVDQFGDIYAANFASNTVTEYAASSNGDAPPIVTLSGAALARPAGIAVAASSATPGPSPMPATPTPTPTPTATPTAGPTPVGLLVSTSSITFPVIGTGTKSTPAALTIGNTGSATLLVNVDASAVMGTGAFKVTGAGPFKLLHNHTKAIKVTFAPSSSGTFGANMSVATNSLSAPVTVMVTGSAQSGTLSAPATLSFGSIAVHHSQTQTLTIQNTGLGVLKGKVVASGLKKPFQLLSGGGAFTLSDTKTRVVKVKFAPTSGTPSGTPFTGTITITSDDPANLSQSVTVSGTGT
jgi:hypothetical protein